MSGALTENKHDNKSSRRMPWRVMAWSVPVFLLLLPLIAMQFTDQVVWGPFDFLFMGALMGSTGLAIELLVRKTSQAAYRIAGSAAFILMFLAIWVELATGGISRSIM